MTELHLIAGLQPTAAGTSLHPHACGCGWLSSWGSRTPNFEYDAPCRFNLRRIGNDEVPHAHAAASVANNLKALVKCGWKAPESIRTGRKRHLRVELREAPAVYRVEIGNTNRPLHWYVGETNNFAGRMSQYGVMVRRLLAIQSNVAPVIIDKDKFRWVQFEVADAMLKSTPVTWRWRYVPSKACALEAEDAEIATAKHQFPNASSLNIECGDRHNYFDDCSRLAVPAAWQEAHRRLRTARSEKKFVVHGGRPTRRNEPWPALQLHHALPCRT